MGSLNKRLENIAVNIRTVQKRVKVPLPANEHSVQLVCFGPSLRRTWGLIDTTKPIVTVSGAHDFLRERGIIPTYHVEFDWRAHKALHITDPKETVFWLASCCHPDVINKVPDPSLWHAEQSLEEVEFIKEREGSAFFIPGGSSVGLRAIELLYARGCRHFEIHGMDSSFDDDAEWAGPHYGKSRLIRDVIDVVAGGKSFKTSVAFLNYAGQFSVCRRLHPDVTFNLHGEGFLQTVNKMEIAA